VAQNHGRRLLVNRLPKFPEKQMLLHQIHDRLAVVMAAAEVLESTHPEGEDLKNLKLIQRHAKELARMIGDLANLH